MTISIKTLFHKGQSPNALDKKDFIWVPSINLYFAKERSHYGLNWRETHKALIPQGLKMPKPQETWALIHYLKSTLDNSEHRKVYDDILKPHPDECLREKNRGEWQNAVYTEKDGEWDVQNVIGLNWFEGLRLTPKEKLRSYLNRPKCCFFADITSEQYISDQGLCKKESPKQEYSQGENIYFIGPTNDPGITPYVGYFLAGCLRAIQFCDRNPKKGFYEVGVRACTESLEGRC